MTAKPLPASAQRVQDALIAAGTDARVVELPVAAERANRAIEDELGVVGGRPLALDFDAPGMERRLLLAVTELHTRQDIDALVGVLGRLS